MANLAPIFLNGVYSTVQAGSSAIGSSAATGVNVATGDGANFGTIGTNQFIPAVVVDTSTSPETVKEYVWITARSTDALTVVRQAEESSRFPASTTTIQAGYVIAAVASKSGLGHLPADDPWKPQAILNTSGGYMRPGWFNPTNWSNAGFAAAAGDTYYLPIYCGIDMQFDRLAINVSTAGAAGKLARLGIYSMGSNRMPDALALDAGTVAVDSTGAKEITISQTLSRGYWYLAFVSDGAPTCLAVGPTSVYPAFPMTVGLVNGLNSPCITPRATGRTADVAGGLPSTAPTLDFGVTGGGRGYPFLRMVTGT